MSSCSNPKHFSGRVWFRPTKPRTAVMLSVEKLMGNDARDSHNQMQTVSVGDHAVLSGLEATNWHTTCVHVCLQRKDLFNTGNNHVEKTKFMLMHMLTLLECPQGASRSPTTPRSPPRSRSYHFFNSGETLMRITNLNRDLKSHLIYS